MLNLKKVNIKNFYKLKNFVLSKTDASVHSPYHCNILKCILMRRCYYIEKNGKPIGLILVDINLKEIYFLPGDTSKIPFYSLLCILKKKLPYKKFKLIIRYQNINLELYEKYFNFDLLSDLKSMSMDLICTLKIDETKINKLKFRNMIIDSEEHIRVQLQNQIFEDKKGRRDLTLEEVLTEEKSPRFLSNLCFIFEENEPCGYGQIIFSDSKYNLVNFGISPQYRNRGYANLFLRSIVNECYSYGIKKLFLNVDNNNPKAMELYKSIGFKELYNDAQILI